MLNARRSARSLDSGSRTVCRRHTASLAPCQDWSLAKALLTSPREVVVDWIDHKSTMAPPRKDRVQPTRPILSTRPEANKPKRKDIQLNKAIKQPQTFDEDYSATADYDGSKSSKQQKQKHSPTISTKKIPVKDVTPRKPQHAVIDDDNEDGDEVTYGVLYRRNRPFRLFLQSYIANHLGEWLTYLASISAIEQIQAAKGEQSTQLAISLLIVIRLTPNVLLCPFGGVLADGWDRRKSMIILDLIGALVSLLFVLAFNCRSIPLIYLSTFLQECVAGLYEPSRSAIIPLLAEDEEELKKATTMAGMAYSVMAAVGSAAGGLLVSLLGIRGCYGMLYWNSNTVTPGRIISQVRSRNSH